MGHYMLGSPTVKDEAPFTFYQRAELFNKTDLTF